MDLFGGGLFPRLSHYQSPPSKDISPMKAGILSVLFKVMASVSIRVPGIHRGLISVC